MTEIEEELSEGFVSETEAIKRIVREKWQITDEKEFIHFIQYRRHKSFFQRQRFAEKTSRRNRRRAHRPNPQDIERHLDGYRIMFGDGPETDITDQDGSRANVAEKPKRPEKFLQQSLQGFT